MSKILHSTPDPLDNPEFNAEITSILRSDAIVFEPEVEDRLFVSPKKILKKILEFHQAQTPLFASPNILAVSEFNESSKNI